MKLLVLLAMLFSFMSADLAYAQRHPKPWPQDRMPSPKPDPNKKPAPMPDVSKARKCTIQNPCKT
jgi:hypothetical protein